MKNNYLCFLFLMQRYKENRTSAKTFSERPVSYYEINRKASIDYRFGLILLHSAMGGTMFSVTSSSRILHRCS